MIYPSVVDPIRTEIDAIVAAARSRGISLVVVGAFAVRAYLRDPDGRRTHDMDVVAPRETLSALRSLLEGRGYRVYASAPWWRAERGEGGGRLVVDIGLGAVVDVATFESYPIEPSDVIEVAEPGSLPLPVPKLEHVLAMKLLANRDKDLLDVMALLRDAGDRLDASRFWGGLEARDLEIPIRRGYLAFVAAAESGELARLWEQRSGKPPGEALAAAAAKLHDLFR